ncbi:hypothetical protein ROZALSC1DRAFT_27632 [Rozella allomycis CSF55]|uniref:Uncharacterized protein n=1 Tax=Rozella allomycis (strain CSF55) TaxID=988480 RepID=A0A4V1J0A9_ROZAC|nr:hypothetical protein ROZALSC1DRAFT_27632 [Rozella allomycis CSF55]
MMTITLTDLKKPNIFFDARIFKSSLAYFPSSEEINAKVVVLTKFKVISTNSNLKGMSLGDFGCFVYDEIENIFRNALPIRDLSTPAARDQFNIEQAIVLAKTDSELPFCIEPKTFDFIEIKNVNQNMTSVSLVVRVLKIKDLPRENMLILEVTDYTENPDFWHVEQCSALQFGKVYQISHLFVKKNREDEPKYIFSLRGSVCKPFEEIFKILDSDHPLAKNILT